MAKRTDELKRYRTKVTRRGKNQCWHWRGSLDKKGYAHFYVIDASTTTGMRAVPAHRYTYELTNGEIPAGKVVSHACNSRDCQNPRHLRLMERLEPSRRENRRPITQCPRGHKYTPANTIIHSKTGARMCRTCTREKQREYMRKVREQKIATVVRPALNRRPVSV